MFGSYPDILFAKKFPGSLMAKAMHKRVFRYTRLRIEI